MNDEREREDRVDLEHSGEGGIRAGYLTRGFDTSVESGEARPSGEQIRSCFDALGGFEEFMKMDAVERVAALRKYYEIERGALGLERKNQLLVSGRETGLFVVKPEAFTSHRMVVKRLQEDWGLGLLGVEPFKYSLAGYLAIYLQIFEQSPMVFKDTLPGLIALHTNWNSFAVVFEHADDYRKVFLERTGQSPVAWAGEARGSYHDFKRLVVGSGDNPPPLSLREIILPEIYMRGFMDFRWGVACAIDFESRLAARGLDANRRTFNGVHSPASGESCNKCLNVIFS